MSIPRIKKNDVVTVISGANAGKSGKVLQVIVARNRAVVEGVNLVKKALRKSQDNPQGGIVEKEASLPLAKLLLMCPECKKGVRVKRVAVDGKTQRKCKRCGHSFDS